MKSRWTHRRSLKAKLILLDSKTGEPIDETVLFIGKVVLESDEHELREVRSPRHVVIEASGMPDLSALRDALDGDALRAAIKPKTTKKGGDVARQFNDLLDSLTSVLGGGRSK